jgi:two-component system, cell cycle response regulator DivK
MGATSWYAATVKRIALVEDNDDNRALIAAILDDAEGYELREYVDGPSALEGMTHDRPDLVLLDVSLPGMDGTEVLERLRAREDLRALPVVVLTAHAMRGDRERFLALGFDAYIGKPIVDDDELVRTIQRLLGAAP